MQQKNSLSLHGFLLGLIVGVVVTLLFTTKKGRQILRTLTQEGLHKFSEVEDIIGALEQEANEDDIEEADAKDFISSEEEQVREQKKQHAPASGNRKFFRKSSKK